MVLFSSCLSAQCPLSIIFLYNPLNLIYSSNVLIILSMKIFLLSFCHKTPLSLIFTPPCLPSSSLLVHFLLLWIVDPCGEQAKQRSSDLSLSLSSHWDTKAFLGYLRDISPAFLASAVFHSSSLQCILQPLQASLLPAPYIHLI